MKCAAILALIGAAGAVSGVQAQALRVVTDPSGTYLRSWRGAPWAGGSGGGADTLVWTFNDPVAIAQSVALSPASSSAWVGQWLNVERLQRFAIPGPAVPTFESGAGSQSPSIVAAAKGADLAVFIDLPNSPTPGTRFQARAYRAAGGAPVWTREFSDIYDGTGYSNLKVSHDGTTVAVGLNQGGSASALYFLDGASGAVRQTWFGETGTLGSVDLTDDGSRCLVQHTTNAAIARVIDTATGLEVFSDFGSGSGSRYQISGNGDVLVVGGFSFYVYRRIGAVYTRVINFSTPTSWFGWGSAVSRDGSTVAAMSHDYAASYLTTATRIWDMQTLALLGTYPTSGTGNLQDSIVGAALSDNGSRLLTASWGTLDNAHPEVLVFDRGVHLIDSLDPPGSPFSIDLSGDGRYALIGTKSVHANYFGNGGNTYVLDLGFDSNCDGSRVPPILNVQDFSCFVQKIAAADPYANCDGSTTPPVLNVQDFTCFLQKFAAGL
jgi:hypothetical protein